RAPQGPAAWEMLYERAVCHEMLGDWPAAEADLERSVALDGNRALSLNHLGYTWVDRNERVAEGLALIERAIAIDPNNAYFIDSLGWAYYRLGEFGIAVDLLERAVALLPDHPTLNDHLGDAYWRIGRRIEARF